MKKKRLRSGIVKLFEEASFLGFAVVLISSSIVLASTINSRSGAASAVGSQGRVVLDNNIALTIEVVGRNQAAKTEDGESILYNGEKTDLRIYYRADGGAVTAGSRAVLTLPSNDSANGIFFCAGASEYPQFVSVLDNSGDDIGVAVIDAGGVIEITFSRPLAEGGGGMFTIDGQNVFILEDSASDDAFIEFTASNPGSAEGGVPVVAHANILANIDGVGVAPLEGDEKAVGWVNCDSYEDGGVMRLGVSYRSSKYGISDGDLLMLKLPSADGGVIGFAPIIGSLNFALDGALVGTAVFHDFNEDPGGSQDVSVVFTSSDNPEAPLSGSVSLPFTCVYGDGFNGGAAQYGVHVAVVGCGSVVLTLPAK